MAPRIPRSRHAFGCSIPAFRAHGRGFEIVFRYRSSRYEISVENPAGVCRGVVATKLDGVLTEGSESHVPLVDDGATHRVQVVLG